MTIQSGKGLRALRSFAARTAHKSELVVLAASVPEITPPLCPCSDMDGGHENIPHKQFAKFTEKQAEVQESLETLGRVILKT